MLTTNQIVAYAVGLTNSGVRLNPQKVTLQAATTAFAVNVKLTNGTSPYPIGTFVRVYYAPTTFSETAAVGAAALRTAAEVIEIPLPESAGTVTISPGEITPRVGDYLYLWLDIPTLPVDATLSVDIKEMP